MDVTAIHVGWSAYGLLLLVVGAGSKRPCVRITYTR